MAFTIKKLICYVLKNWRKSAKTRRRKAKSLKNVNEDIHQAVTPTRVNIRKRRRKKRRKNEKSAKRKRKNVPDILPVQLPVLHDHHHDLLNFDILEVNVRPARHFWLSS